MGVTSVVTAILSIMVLSKTLQTMASFEEYRNFLSCDLTVIKSAFVVQTDENGRNCSGSIPIVGCMGRCLSHAVPYWKFPYKKSYHQVCIHDEGGEVEELLQDCDTGVALEAKKYRYFKARSCKCSICDSSQASCESLRKRGEPSHPAIQDTNRLLDILITAAKTRNSEWSESIPQVPQPPVYS